MKRITFFLSVFLLAVVGIRPTAGQNFSDAKVYENESEKVVIPNLSEREQYDLGTCKGADGVKAWANKNRAAITELVSEADQVVVLGLQDESGSFIPGLGACRASKVAELINEWTWGSLFKTLKVSTREYQLSNDEKTEILEEHQEYLNQRGVALVAFSDSDTVPSDFWWPAWILWLIGGIAALALLLHLFRWLERDGSESQQPRTPNQTTTNGNSRGGTGSVTNSSSDDSSPDMSGDESGDDRGESTESNEGSVPPVFDPDSSESSSGSDQVGSSGGNVVNIYGDFHGDQHIHG